VNNLHLLFIESSRKFVCPQHMLIVTELAGILLNVLKTTLFNKMYICTQSQFLYLKKEKNIFFEGEWIGQD
jgi:hypothetical protein